MVSDGGGVVERYPGAKSRTTRVPWDGHDILKFMY